MMATQLQKLTEWGQQMLSCRLGRGHQLSAVHLCRLWVGSLMEYVSVGEQLHQSPVQEVDGVIESTPPLDYRAGKTLERQRTRLHLVIGSMSLGLVVPTRTAGTSTLCPSTMLRSEWACDAGSRTYMVFILDCCYPVLAHIWPPRVGKGLMGNIEVVKISQILLKAFSFKALSHIFKTWCHILPAGHFMIHFQPNLSPWLVKVWHA